MRPTTPLAMEELGSGPPLLLLHGAGGSPRAAFPFLEKLAERFTVLAPDLPGVGDSELGDAPLTVSGVVDRILETLDRARVDRVAVCGYSMGTLLAAGLAASAPGRVGALVLTAGLARATAPCRDLLQRWSDMLAADPEVLGRFVVDHIYRPKTIVARGNTWYTTTVEEVGAGFPPGTRAHIALVAAADVREALASTTQPLHLVVPRHDVFVTPDHSAEIRRLRPEVTATFLAGGHALGDERPDAWFDAMTGFLDRHLAPSPT